MAASLSWIDFSAADRERMRRAMALFQDRETRDELGVGTIRDAFSDALFPGTSTIMTRLRYFLFVPWIYRELEASRVKSGDVARRLRTLEEELIRCLKTFEDSGVVGGRAADAVQRTPSSIYWAGLQRWGLALYGGSQAQYHHELDRIRRLRSALEVADDEGGERATLSTWHPQIPPAPKDWRQSATFALRLEEAEFLRGRLFALHPNSLLCWLANHAEAPDSDYPWELPGFGGLPAHLQDLLTLARRFSFALHGASRLYNLQLAEKAGRAELVEEHRTLLQAWGQSPETNDFAADWLPDLWAFVEAQGAHVSFLTREFVRGWVDVCRKEGTDLASNARARRLVREREVRLKGPRSRFTNQRALETWNGHSGVARLQYRWGVAQRLLRDLCDGLRAKEGT